MIMVLNKYRNLFIDKIECITTNKRKIIYGEVFTPCNVVLYMLNLVGFAKEKNFLSKVFEPGCGTGNFLIEILNFKLNNLTKIISKNNSNKNEYLILLAISSIYGCDINDDNLTFTRQRLYKFVKKFCLTKLKIKPSIAFLKSINKLLSQTIFKMDCLKIKKIKMHQLPLFYLFDDQIIYCYNHCFFNVDADIDNTLQQSLFNIKTYNSTTVLNKYITLRYNQLISFINNNFFMNKQKSSRLGREREREREYMSTII